MKMGQFKKKIKKLLLYVNDMSQAVAIDCDLFLYANGSCFFLSAKKRYKKIERNLTKNASNVCDWFVDNKL